MVKVPASLHVPSGAEGEQKIKWTDNVADGDIMNVYVQGDAAPAGRFKFVYRVK